MRSGDLTPPAVTPHVLPPDAPMAAWPYQLRVALEYLPQAAYTWDDADPDVVWAGPPPEPDVLLEPFINFTTNGWSLYNGGGGNPTIVPGRTGTCARMTLAGEAAYLMAAPARSDYITFGFAYKLSAWATQATIVRLQTGGTDHVRLKANSDGSIGFTDATGSTFLGASAAGVITVNTWQYVEAQVRLHDTLGTCTIRVNGVTRVTATNKDTRNGAATVFDTVRLVEPYGFSGESNYIDDLYIRTGPAATFRGDIPIPAAAARVEPGEELVWDAPFIGAGFTDVVCDLISLTVDPGDIDELGLFPPCQATLTLANPDGRYTVWTADGRLVYWAPGRRICIWAVDVDTGVSWWIFSGRVTSWVDDTAGLVTVEAFDGLAGLADELGADWTPGTAGQRPLARIQAVAAQVGYDDPIGGDVGDNPLNTALTDLSPLEVCQVAALSDGGVFHGDADGRLLYRDRLWRAGRSDQTLVPVVSDNVCTVDAVIWDPQMSLDDEGLYTRVELVNSAGLVATSALAVGDPNVWWSGTRYRLSHPDPDLWQTQGAGDLLAAYLLAQQSTPSLALRAFTLHLHDPRQQLWPIGVDLRRGDRIRFLHDHLDAAGRETVLDIYLIAASIRHEITADTWTVTVAGTRTVDWTTVERWDDTALVWDDSNPLAVWRY